MARRSAVVEAALLGAGSAVLGGLVLFPFGLAPVGAVLAGANGIISGWRGIYDWRRGPGWAGAVLDATWGLVDVTAALAVHALSRRGDPGYLPALSRRQGRHVYRHGFTPRKRFAFTVGNTITNARDIEDESRRMLIERHEGLHVWQQRWFGPLFPLVYGLWMVGGALTGSVAWLLHRNREPWAVVVERHAYYYNPFEHWAYAADGAWPPARMTRLMAEGRQPG